MTIPVASWSRMKIPWEEDDDDNDNNDDHSFELSDLRDGSF